MSATNTAIQRLLPDTRRFTVPAGQQGLLVRTGELAQVMPAGDHPVRGWFQPQPEIYLIPSKALPVFVWITDLTSADGKSVNLSWRVMVRVADASRLWAEWLRFQETNEIVLPAEEISARTADQAQEELVSRFALEDLRTDPETRRLVGGKLSLLIKDRLADVGLEIADQLDFARMRFVTEADLAAAQRERETLTRLVEDEKLQTAINRIDNAETLRYRLQEWLSEHNAELSQTTVDELVAASFNGESPASALAAAVSAPAPAVDQATPKPVELNMPVHEGQGRLLRNLSQFFAIGSVLTALIIAAIATFEPGLLDSLDERIRITGIVVGVAMIGLLIAWTIDQIMRWEARNTARRLLSEAHLDPGDIEVGRLETRHLLILLGAMVGLGAAAVAFWVPDLYPWFRLSGGFVGLMGAAMAIRMDWLHNIETSFRIRQSAQRRIATAMLTAAQRQRRHRRFQADLAAEATIVVKILDEAKQRIYRELNDRKLYTRLQRTERKFTEMQPRIDALQNADGERSAEDWASVDTQMTTLQEEIKRSSQLAEAIHWSAGQKETDRVAEQIEELEQSAQEVENLILRWSAVIA